jgi:predicted Zn-dependent protease
VKPLRLRIVKVGPSDSVESLASRLVLIDHQVERFRALNGLESNERPRPGDFVKIIIE